MKAITNEYLADLILRQINKQILTHRSNKNSSFTHGNLPCATDGELLDFIQTIPYFHENLKDFLVGNLQDATIIISQSWELEFLKKAIMWAESFEWLHGTDYFLTDAHINSIKKNISYLSLPY